MIICYAVPDIWHMTNVIVIFHFGLFFNCYLAAPWQTLGHHWGGSLTHMMLITCILHIQPIGHRKPHNEVGSLSLVEHLVGFELGTFWFWSQHLNPLGHFPFYPYNTLKNENFKKMKKYHTDIIISHICTKSHDHMLYCSWDMSNCYFLFWAIFCPFTPSPPSPITAQKIKI